MSEKRFILAYGNGNEAIFEDRKHFYSKRMNNKEVEKMLNSLAEENEQLKSTIIHLEEECGARENDYMNLKKQLDKIPPRIKEIWLNG